MNKHPEITASTRDAFIEAFCDLCKVNPMDKITVKEIAHKAGYSRATFYNYFKDTYDLLEYIENELIASLMEAITHNIAARQLLDHFIQTFIELIGQKSRYLHVFMNSSNNSSFADRLKIKVMPLLASTLRVPPENVKAKYALEFYISGLVPVIGSWLKNGQDIPVEELAELIKGILQEGILKQTMPCLKNIGQVK